MNRKSWNRTTLILGAGALFAGTAFSQSPPFDGRTVFEGSMTYNPSDYTLTGSAPVGMWPDGLRVYAFGSDDETSIQHKTAFTPTAGLVARARFRLFVDHIGDNDSKFGFWSTTEDIFGIEDPPDPPDDGAYFFVEHVDCRWDPCSVQCTQDDCDEDRVFGKVYAVVEGQTPRFIFELSDETFHDFLVEIDGTSTVKFYHKAPSDADWASCGTTCEFDEDLPDGPMRFSAAVIKNPGASAGHIRMKVFEFELERD